MLGGWAGGGGSRGQGAAGGAGGSRGQQGAAGGHLEGALGGGHWEGCDLQGRGWGGGIISYIIDSLVMTNYYF